MIDAILNSGLYIDLVFILGIGIVGKMIIDEERLKDEKDKSDSSNK